MRQTSGHDGVQQGDHCETIRHIDYFTTQVAKRQHDNGRFFTCDVDDEFKRLDDHTRHHSHQIKITNYAGTTELANTAVVNNLRQSITNPRVTPRVHMDGNQVIICDAVDAIQRKSIKTSTTTAMLNSRRIDGTYPEEEVNIFWDNVSGERLGMDSVLHVRAEEIREVRKHGVCTKVAVTGKAQIGVG